MLTGLKKNYLLLLLIIIAFLWLFISFESGTIPFGLDNASNYFFPLDIFTRITEGEAFIYSGLIYTAPFFHLFRLVGITPELLSWGYFFFCLISGVTGIYMLTAINSRRHHEGIAGFVSGLYLLSTLFSVWIFNQPNFLFLAAYASIPWIIFYIQYISLGERMGVLRYSHLFFISLIFMTTTLNVVAFSLYCMQIGLIALCLGHSSGIKFRNSLKTLTLWLVIITAAFLIPMQTLLWMNSKTLIHHEFMDYLTDMRSNRIVSEVTEDLRESEIKHNDIINVVRFAAGWTELHDTSGDRIFTNTQIYERTSFKILGMIPFLFAILLLPNKIMREKLLLFALLCIGIIINTRYFLTLTENNYILANALRWPTSKLWPLVILPIGLLFGSSVAIAHEGLEKRKLFANILLILTPFILIIYAYPIIMKGPVSPQVKVSLPPEYYSLKSLGHDHTILVLPQPQKIYFREFDWGYYGDDFISYITNAKVIDDSNLYFKPGEYENQLKKLVSCKLDVDYVLINHEPTKAAVFDCPYTEKFTYRHYTLFKLTDKR